jgi:hypothetical protein
MNTREVSAKTKYTLLTNIDFVNFRGLRLDCTALLVELGANGIFEPVDRIRGFGPDQEWPVFKMFLAKEHLPFTIQTAEDKSKMFLSDDGGMKPIFTGNQLILANKEAMFLQAQKENQPLDVFECVGKIERVWAMLIEKTHLYCDTPNMPFLSWHEPTYRPRRSTKGGNPICFQRFD